MIARMTSSQNRTAAGGRIPDWPRIENRRQIHALHLFRCLADHAVLHRPAAGDIDVIDEIDGAAKRIAELRDAFFDPSGHIAGGIFLQTRLGDPADQAVDQGGQPASEQYQPRRARKPAGRRVVAWAAQSTKTMPSSKPTVIATIRPAPRRRRTTSPSGRSPAGLPSMRWEAWQLLQYSRGRCGLLLEPVAASNRLRLLARSLRPPDQSIPYTLRNTHSAVISSTKMTSGAQPFHSGLLVGLGVSRSRLGMAGQAVPGHLRPSIPSRSSPRPDGSRAAD